MLSPPPHLFAFGFLNAAILGWLAAAAAPILIHLWMKRVRRETEWAAVRFLRRAIERHSRRLKLREWLLLAIRTAILLLVVMAAAKPVLDSFGLAGPGVRTHYLLVVDASLSMRYQTDNGTLLQTAKRLAGKLIDDSRSGDVYSLLVMADPPRAVVALPTSDRTRVRQAIESIEPTDGAADLAEMLSSARQMLERSEDQTEHVDRHEMVIFSDLARHTWGEAVKLGEDADSLGVHQVLKTLAESAELSVVDLGVDGAANASITRLAIAEPLPTAGHPLRLTATARRTGPIGEASNQTAELLVDGSTVATQQVLLPADGAATIDFTHRFDRPGAHAVEVRLVEMQLGEDALPADNSGWLGAVLPEQTRVLCVAGGPGAARYVASALRPGGESDEQAIEPVVVTDAEFTSVDLSEYAAVFFCNVAQLSPSEAERVADYVRGGGGVVFFLGDRVLPEAYNRVLMGKPLELGTTIDGATRPLTPVSDAAEVASLIPAAIDQPVDSQSYTIDPLDYTHPIVRPFEGRERAGLLTTPIARYWRLVLDDRADTETALASTTGDPLLFTSTFGQGRIAVVATAGSLESVDSTTGEPWTVMPAWPSFLPLVRGMLNHTAGRGESASEVLVGELIQGVAVAGMSEVEIVRPDERVANAELSDGHVWTYSEADAAGVYLARASGELDAMAAVAVNVPPAESDLTRVAAGSLSDSLQVRRNSTWSPSGSALPTSTGIHRTLLLAALGLVLVETTLAYWFGRPPT